ncbi:hypothetical protein RRG08_020655 [Elysia crispata]|uniref:Uncharacterized protein n=1 Tax=Elysia crispata TaxID=231223 RepID=A0AAE0Z5C4_9GAST|nr:hypothetical protein RRG08_020655 [Elysia crispata]
MKLISEVCYVLIHCWNYLAEQPKLLHAPQVYLAESVLFNPVRRKVKAGRLALVSGIVRNLAGLEPLSGTSALWIFCRVVRAVDPRAGFFARSWSAGKSKVKQLQTAVRQIIWGHCARVKIASSGGSFGPEYLKEQWP